MTINFQKLKSSSHSDQLSYVMNLLMLDSSIDGMVFDCISSGEYHKMQALEGAVRLLLVKVKPFAYKRPSYRDIFDAKVRPILKEMDENPRHQTNKYDDFQYFKQLILPLYEIIVMEYSSIRGIFPTYGARIVAGKGIVPDFDDKLGEAIEGGEDDSETTSA